MKVLFIVPYPTGEAPSQRFRFEQYFNDLERNGIEFEISAFLDSEAWNILYKKGRLSGKISGIAAGLIRRIKDVLRSKNYDFIFIHREAAPFGPPVFEWILGKLLSSRIIYDFDDAIWLPNVSESNRRLSRIKWYHKVSAICRWSYRVSCGNEFLQSYAMQYNKDVIVNPTVVNTEKHYNKIKSHNATIPTIIGWTGTHSTSRYLNDLLPVMQKLEERFHVEFKIISDAPPVLPLKTMRYTPWKKASEIEDLLMFDIGIMPLPDDEWAKGKCGFKLIQYLSLGIPAVCSPVGVNDKIIDHGKSGFLASSHEEWFDYLALLIQNPEKRKQFGKEGRVKITSHFSADANAALFLSSFA